MRTNSKKALCHPDRPHYAKLKCGKCYRDTYDKKNKNNPRVKQRVREATKRYLQTSKGLLCLRKKTRKHELKKKYRMMEEDFQRMLKNQNNVCAICLQPEPSTFKRPLSVDHNHNTHENRGLLCHFCNTALGLFKDNPELLLKASYYLETHNIKKVDHVPLG